jgi:hypothetical protein
MAKVAAKLTTQLMSGKKSSPLAATIERKITISDKKKINLNTSVVRERKT